MKSSAAAVQTSEPRAARDEALFAAIRAQAEHQ